MKKLLFTLSLATACFAVHAQNTFPTSGNAGIGTTSPNSTLDVHGYASFGGNSGNLDSRNPPGGLTYLANSGQMVVGWNRTQGNGETDFISNQGAGGAGGFAFYNHDNSNNETMLMWLFGNGQLVIGNGQGKQGNYLLAVAGSAIATSFTVKSVANWPDYVFKSGYRLPSLNDVKAYIDQNHHLQDVPSAEQVAKDGLNLGDMNKITMQKVEELTLYLIEKDEIIRKQQNQIEIQAETIKQISAQQQTQQAQIDLLTKLVLNSSRK